MRAALAGEAPPSTSPTNVPGSAISPTVRVWSIEGTSPLTTARAIASPHASRTVIPRQSRVSIASTSRATVSRSARPAMVTALIVPPIMIPAVATTSSPPLGTACVRSSADATSPAGAPIDIASGARSPGRASRPRTVQAAVPSITAMKSAASTEWRETRPSAAPTIRSCIAPRAPARTSAAVSGTRVHLASAAALPTNAAARASCVATVPLMSSPQGAG